MPNLDIKGTFLAGPELKILTKLLGSRALAIGSVVEFWELAAEYWGRGGQLVPRSAFDAVELPAALYSSEVGLAEIREGGIYARGSEEHFRWLRDRRDAGRMGGIASAVSRKSTSNKNKGVAEANGQATLKQLKLPVPVPIPVPEEEDRRPAEEVEEALPELAQIWNQFADPCLPRVRSCGLKRKRKIQLAWKRKPARNFWVDLIKLVNESDFLSGRVKDWRADFEFILSDENVDKILDGKYANRGQARIVNSVVEEINAK